MPSHEFKKVLSRPIRTQDMEFYNQPVFDFSNGKIKEIIYVPNDGKLEGWYREDEFLNFMEYLANKIKKPSWSIDKHLKDFNVITREFKKGAYGLAHASKNKSLKELEFYYKRYVKKWDNFLQFIWTPWSINYILDDWFSEALKGKYSDWQEIYESLAVSSKPIQMQQLTEKVLQWKVKNGSKEELEKLAKKYGHMGG